jgi:hypothetical protein
MKCPHGPRMIQSRGDRSTGPDLYRRPPAEVTEHCGTDVSEPVPVSRCSACSHVSKDSPARLGAPRMDEPLSIVLGRRLRWLRVERRLSRKHVAERLGVPVENVEGHERGTRRMEPRDLVAYVHLFRVRISEFFKDPPTKGTA